MNLQHNLQHPTLHINCLSGSEDVPKAQTVLYNFGAIFLLVCLKKPYFSGRACERTAQISFNKTITLGMFNFWEEESLSLDFLQCNEWFRNHKFKILQPWNIQDRNNTVFMQRAHVAAAVEFFEKRIQNQTYAIVHKLLKELFKFIACFSIFWRKTAYATFCNLQETS